MSYPASIDLIIDSDEEDDDWEHEPPKKKQAKAPSAPAPGGGGEPGEPLTGPATDDWCMCGNCDVTDSSLPYGERLCCQNDLRSNEFRLSGLPESLDQPEVVPECVCYNPRFTYTCLDRPKLITDIRTWRDTLSYDIVDPPTGPTNKKLRYIAYREYIKRVHGRLGVAIRVVIPSCALRRIRQEYPAAPGEGYEGFHQYSAANMMLDA